ncbi:MAG: UDP-3-O-(3-hydroxymyristoyl)glucosamine N-acyltransferase [Alphaproteobacteria bacterium]|nr:UDP-3-O-(3-hydroxymyristoyl)glucosamine N-acyltransferase [Alphaproteobacteria bacterium]HCQ70871.1 UDP-3-O-(3-hydroxymyristoyl)glucosamine N-acyltransferase [Rhodospirillaceae bacterium]|tara:strand:- start:38274 stop:39251 length:978 start_codon:yes stop_codon:yes gene_type:complete
MADPRFFKNTGDKKLSEIASLCGADLINPEKYADMVISDVAPLDTAGAQDLSFLDNRKYKDQFLKTKAGACFVSPAMAEYAPDGVALLVSAAPYRAYALAAQAFYPPGNPAGDETVVEDGAVIKPGVVLGKGCWIEAGAVIGENVVLGDYCRVGSNAVISHAQLGNNVRIYPGAKIGQDGFGFAIDPRGFVKVPQLGRVIIHDHVEIGANTTIDRGAGPDTVIGAGTWIDNLVQIGHNVKIGRCCVIVSQVGISGSTVLDDFVMMGGQSGVAGHLKIGSGARIAAQSGIMRDVPAGEEQMGSPAMPSKQFMRQVAALKRLINKAK